MHLGVVIEETWDFFSDVYKDFETHHETSLFSRRTLKTPILNERINRFLLRRNLASFLETKDVVFFEWASELLALASHLPKTARLVTRLHRYEMYQWADKINWAAIDRLILVSHAKQREFSTRFPEYAHKSVVIPESISLERFTLHQKPFNGDIGILCHLRPRKRVYELILAFYEVLQVQPGVHLHIGGGSPAGPDEYFEGLQALVRNLEIDESVTFYGRVTNPHGWYQNLDIFISNSYSEGLQVSPMEAIASGCYCLSHFWDGADELLPEENLFFSERELVERLLHYTHLSDEERNKRRDLLRKKICDEFDVNQIKIRIRQVVEEAQHAPQSV